MDHLIELSFEFSKASMLNSVLFLVEQLWYLSLLLLLLLASHAIVSFYKNLDDPYGRVASYQVDTPDLSPSERELDLELSELLVVCNPVAGSGQGRRVCEGVVLPMLQKAGIKYSLIVTKSASQCTEIGRNLSKDQAGLVVIGGDGTFHEIIRGIALKEATNSDPDLIRKFMRTCPVGIVPCGTADGLASSLGFNDPFEAMRRVIQTYISFRASLRSPKSRLKATTALDLYSVRNRRSKKSWNHKMMKEGGTGSKTLERDQDETSPSDNVIFDFHLACWGVMAEVAFSVEETHRDVAPFFRIPMAFIENLGPIRYQPKEGVVRIKEVGGEEHVLKGKFVTVCVSNVSYGAPKFLVAPKARPDDGCLWVTVVEDIGRIEFLQSAMAMARCDGSHLQHPWVKNFCATEVEIVNATGGVAVCGSKAEELLKLKDVSEHNGFVFKNHPGVLRLLY